MYQFHRGNQKKSSRNRKQTRLHVHCRIPCRVQDDDPVGAGQVEASRDKQTELGGSSPAQRFGSSPVQSGERGVPAACVRGHLQKGHHWTPIGSAKCVCVCVFLVIYYVYPRDPHTL